MLMISRMFDWQNCLTAVLRFKSEKGGFFLHLLLQGLEEKAKSFDYQMGKPQKNAKFIS